MPTRRKSRRKSTRRRNRMRGGAIPTISNIRTKWFRDAVRSGLEGIAVREMQYGGQNIFVIESAVAKKTIAHLQSSVMETATSKRIEYADRAEFHAYFEALDAYVKEHTIESPVSGKEYVLYAEWEKIF